MQNSIDFLVYKNLIQRTGLTPLQITQMPQAKYEQMMAEEKKRMFIPETTSLLDLNLLTDKDFEKHYKN